MLVRFSGTEILLEILLILFKFATLYNVKIMGMRGLKLLIMYYADAVRKIFCFLSHLP